MGWQMSKVDWTCNEVEASGNVIDEGAEVTVIVSKRCCPVYALGFLSASTEGVFSLLF